jgi:hypothetical protein
MLPFELIRHGVGRLTAIRSDLERWMDQQARLRLGAPVPRQPQPAVSPPVSRPRAGGTRAASSRPAPASVLVGRAGVLIRNQDAHRGATASGLGWGAPLKSALNKMQQPGVFLAVERHHFEEDAMQAVVYAAFACGKVA